MPAEDVEQTGRQRGAMAAGPGDSRGGGRGEVLAPGPTHTQAGTLSKPKLPGSVPSSVP